jgi:chemotaxis protein MotA
MLANDGIEWWENGARCPFALARLGSPCRHLESLSLERSNHWMRTRHGAPFRLRVRQNRRELGMFAIIGIVVVLGCVVAIIMEHGTCGYLCACELIIITAPPSALSSSRILSISSRKLLAASVFLAAQFESKPIDTLPVYDPLNKARKDGLMALESDVEEPQKSPVFTKNPAFLKNHHVCDFVCDSLRMAITGIDAFDLDQMLDLDLEVHHQDSTGPTAALTTMADSLPGLGIVAAVLGVVISMGALGSPPEEINKVAAALVGTFSAFCSVAD